MVINMKKLFLIAFCIIICGCSKKQTPAPVTITGKWYVTKTIETHTQNNATEIDTGLYDHNNFYVFNPDKTGSQTIDGENMPFTYLVSDSNLTINYTGSDGTPPTSLIKVLTDTNLDFTDTAYLNGSVVDVFETQLTR